MLEKAIGSLADSSRDEYELVGVACCLSGGGSRRAQEKLHDEFKRRGATYQVYVNNDSLAALFTAFKNGIQLTKSTKKTLKKKICLLLFLKGGLVMIAGTGSNCVLVNPTLSSDDGGATRSLEMHNTGGWGCLLGDEGSGMRF